eukprot:4495191-Amphidinium_carterae.1
MLSWKGEDQQLFITPQASFTRKQSDVTMFDKCPLSTSCDATMYVQSLHGYPLHSFTPHGVLESKCKRTAMTSRGKGIKRMNGQVRSSDRAGFAQHGKGSTQLTHPLNKTQQEKLSKQRQGNQRPRPQEKARMSIAPCETP